MNHYFGCGIAILMTFLIGCQSNKPNKTPEIDWTAYSPIERVIKMRTGIFKRLNVDGSTMLTKGGDSLLMMVSPVGNVAKDGYWMYQELSMANLPEYPLISVFINFKRVSPDTVSARLYNLPKEKTIKYYAGAYFDNTRFSDINFSSLELKDDCIFYFVKQKQTEFGGSMPPCPNASGSQTAKMALSLTPKAYSIVIDVWQTADSTMLFEGMTQIYQRQDPDYYKSFFERLKDDE